MDADVYRSLRGAQRRGNLRTSAGFQLGTGNLVTPDSDPGRELATPFQPQRTPGHAGGGGKRSAGRRRQAVAAPQPSRITDNRLPATDLCLPATKFTKESCGRPFPSAGETPIIEGQMKCSGAEMRDIIKTIKNLLRQALGLQRQHKGGRKADFTDANHTKKKDSRHRP